jgi:hypothetical protein
MAQQTLQPCGFTNSTTICLLQIDGLPNSSTLWLHELVALQTYDLKILQHHCLTNCWLYKLMTLQTYDLTNSGA